MGYPIYLQSLQPCVSTSLVNYYDLEEDDIDFHPTFVTFAQTERSSPPHMISREKLNIKEICCLLLSFYSTHHFILLFCQNNVFIFVYHILLLLVTLTNCAVIVFLPQLHHICCKSSCSYCCDFHKQDTLVSLVWGLLSVNLPVCSFLLANVIFLFNLTKYFTGRIIAT